MAEIIDVIIVGGGASGLFSGLLLAKKGKKVTVLEKNTTVGKKLLLTGNGKCNYTNLYQSEDCYRSREIKKAMKILSTFDVEQILSYFKEIGILPNIKKGRCSYNLDSGYIYPNSESGKDVVTALLEENLSFGVKIRTNTEVTDIKKDGKEFLVTAGESHYTYRARNVILATGGLAAPSTGSDGSLNPIIQKLGHSLIPQLPALTSISSPDKKVKALKGVRLVGKISLYESERLLASEYGELQFSERGISGIPAMQLSGLVSQALAENKKLQVKIDSYPSLAKKELYDYLLNRKEVLGKRKTENFFLGMLNDKLGGLLAQSFFKSYKKVEDIPSYVLEEVSQAIKELSFPIDKVGDFSFSQTTSGGFSLSELNEGLESLFVENLYFTGEILDVDGLCGGYNLTWAWASAFVVAETIGRKS